MSSLVSTASFQYMETCPKFLEYAYWRDNRDEIYSTSTSTVDHWRGIASCMRLKPLEGWHSPPAVTRRSRGLDSAPLTHTPIPWYFHRNPRFDRSSDPLFSAWYRRMRRNHLG